MYSVVRIDANKNLFAQITVFKSYVENECWTFVRNALCASTLYNRESNLDLIVINKLGEYLEPPEIIKILRNSVKNELQNKAA